MPSSWGYCPDLVVREVALAREGRPAITLDCPSRLSINNARSVHGLEKRHLLGNTVLFRFDVAVEQQTQKPASANPHAMPLQDRREHLCVHREPATSLPTGEACLARLLQALLERNVIAQFR